jgi:hypothetical protein
MLRVFLRNSDKFVKSFNVRAIFKTKHIPRGSLMKTGQVTDARMTKLCVYNIPCDYDSCYKGEKIRLSEVCIKEHNTTIIYYGLFSQYA